MPSAIPVRRAWDCAWASWSSSCHCSQQWKSTARRWRSTNSSHRRAARVLQFGRPPRQSPPCFSASAHQVANLSSAAPPGACRPGRPTPARRTPHPVDAFERLPLGRPRGVAVDGLGFPRPGHDRGPQLVHLGALGYPGELRYRLHPQVKRTGEAPRGRQVGRGFHGCGGRGGMQRVDQSEVRAMLRARPHGQIGEVCQIADTPRAFRPDAVDLGQPVPRPAGCPAGPAGPARPA